MATKKTAAKKAAGPGPVPAPAPAAALARSCRLHGSFIYQVQPTINRYGGIDLTVAAMLRMQMSHAWIRIHGTQAYSAAEKQRIRDLTAALRTAGIGVAGWGWCQGSVPLAEANLALRESESLGMTDYVADIEQGVSNAHWTPQEVTAFCQRVRANLPGSFGVTTFGLIDWHEPGLMQAALPFVDFFNPQVYWFNFPNQQMVNQFRRPDGTRYRVNEPGEYMELCIDRWVRLMGGTPKRLVVAGQAYWNEGNTQTQAEAKLVQFLSGWNGYNRVAGLNWWHLGGGSAMSHAMVERIVAARLGQKNYAP